MAIINKTGIADGGLIEAEHITRVIDALSSVSTDTIVATGSFQGTLNGTASFASTASYVMTAQTASYVLNSVSASFATSASRSTSSSFASTATTASYVQTAQTASYVLNAVSASFATSASRAVSSSFASTASFVLSGATVTSASFATSASYALSASFATSSSRAVTSSFAITASHTPNTFVQGGNAFGTTATIGTTDNQPLIFETNNIQTMYISSSGNVAIGSITNPSAKLVISQSANQTAVKITNTGNTDSLVIQDSSGDTSPFVVDSNGNAAIGQTAVGQFASNDFKLDVSGSTRLTAPSSFVSSPPPALQLSNLKDASGRLITTSTKISGSGRYLRTSILRGGYSSDAPVLHKWCADFILESTQELSSTVSTISYTNGWAWAYYTGSSFYGGAGFDFVMCMMASGSRTGNVGIGSSFYEFSQPNYQLQLDKDSAAKPSTNTWTISSDERLKTDIEEANYDTCYDIVKNLPLKRYTWKPEVYTTQQVKDRSKLGWIAQDVESVFPKAVDTNEFRGRDGFYLEDCKSLNSDQIYAAMYGTIKKLITENEVLKSEIDAIKTHLGI